MFDRSQCGEYSITVPNLKKTKKNELLPPTNTAIRTVHCVFCRGAGAVTTNVFAPWNYRD